jgi:hypothetical protein
MPNDKDPREQLTHLLAVLGSTVDEVAQALRVSGCRGFRNGTFPSPIIRYAYRRFDGGSLVLVYSAPAMKPTRLYLYRPNGSRDEILLPVPVTDFLALFDDGHYPDLDLGSGGDCYSGRSEQ